MIDWAADSGLGCGLGPDFDDYCFPMDDRLGCDWAADSDPTSMTTVFRWMIDWAVELTTVFDDDLDWIRMDDILGR